MRERDTGTPCVNISLSNTRLSVRIAYILVINLPGIELIVVSLNLLNMVQNLIIVRSILAANLRQAYVESRPWDS